MKYEVTVGETVYTIEVNQEGELTLDGAEVPVDFSEIGTGLCLLLVNNESFEGLVEQKGDTWRVLFRGDMYEVQVADERAQLMRARSGISVPDSGEWPIKSPMPGMVVSVPVEVGQEVRKGDNVVILESMKMENELKTPRGGKISEIMVKKGDSVDQGQVLVVII